jgi:hypothetical protein
MNQLSLFDNWQFCFEEGNCLKETFSGSFSGAFGAKGKNMGLQRGCCSCYILSLTSDPVHISSLRFYSLDNFMLMSNYNS